jgi:hypothetical protein
LPLYTYKSDTAAGDTMGQGFKSLWYVVSPDGSMVTTPEAMPTP